MFLFPWYRIIGYRVLILFGRHLSFYATPIDTRKFFFFVVVDAAIPHKMFGSVSCCFGIHMFICIPLINCSNYHVFFL